MLCFTESLLELGPYIRVAAAGTAGWALLDTGAYASAIDITFTLGLQLPARGTHETTGATGVGEFPPFDAVLEIPMLGNRGISAAARPASPGIWTPMGRRYRPGCAVPIRAPD